MTSIEHVRSASSLPRVAVIGTGHVGRNIAQRARATHEIITYDVAEDDEYPTEQLSTCDLAIICVPTPSLPSGACDISIVDAAVAAVPVDLVWVRSTVPPGTCDELASRHGKRICFSPEYVGETHFNDAYDLEDFLIIGGRSQDREQIVNFVLETKGPPTRIYRCANAEAELVKYMENTFLAAKVGIVAEFYELSQRIGLDWDSIREAWLADPRVGHAHSHATPGDLGFSGKCLPKDLAALCAFADQIGQPLDVLAAVRDANRKRRSDIT